MSALWCVRFIEIPLYYNNKNKKPLLREISNKKNMLRAHNFRHYEFIYETTVELL